MNAHLAREADRLQNDEIFTKALEDIRAAALNDLALTDAAQTIAILRLQQRVQVIDEIRAMLGRYIIAGGPAQEETAGSFA
mgnify:FL=1